jgi:hypothetical protein
MGQSDISLLGLDSQLPGMASADLIPRQLDPIFPADRLQRVHRHLE